ncbi:MAG: prepilin-type N-terminal cleavage/methylation domain-containing protein [Clostridia bacterium]|nr:prepilin-type N-terminal cleavage/methylation domain-containing protein [Clostridia bacterium]
MNGEKMRVAMMGNKGVTLVELAIVIIIILIIATFAVTSGRKTLDQADASEVYFEMNAMREAINKVTVKQDMDDNFSLTQGEYYDISFTPATGVSYGDNVLGYQDEWYIIFGKDQGEFYKDSKVKDWLGLDAINHTYIVNFNSSSVELYRPVTILNQSVRTYDEVRTLINNS